MLVPPRFLREQRVKTNSNGKILTETFFQFNSQTYKNWILKNSKGQNETKKSMSNKGEASRSCIIVYKECMKGLGRTLDSQKGMGGKS